MFRIRSKIVGVVLAFGFALSANADLAETCDKTLSDAQVLSAYEFSKALNVDAAKAYLEILTGRARSFGSALSERHSPEARELTRQILVHEINQLGLKADFEVFDGGANVIVEIPGSNSEEVVEFGAKFAATRTGTMADAGSGAAMLLSLAKMFAEKKSERTVRLVFLDVWTKTETSAIEAHAANLTTDSRKVIGPIAIENLGYISSGIKSWFAVAAINDLDLGKSVFYPLRRLAAERKVTLSAEPKKKTKSKALKYGAVTLSMAKEEGYENPNTGYFDEFRSLNLSFFTEATRTISEVAANLAKLETTTYDDALLEKENKDIRKTDSLPKALEREVPVVVKAEPKNIVSSGTPTQRVRREKSTGLDKPNEKDPSSFSNLELKLEQDEERAYKQFLLGDPEGRVLILAAEWKSALATSSQSVHTFEVRSAAMILKLYDVVRKEGGVILSANTEDLRWIMLDQWIQIHKLRRTDKSSVLGVYDPFGNTRALVVTRFEPKN
jgi:hypothetical protein